MPEAEISFNPAQIEAIQSRLAGIKDGVPKALAGAINDTTKQTKTLISTEIRGKFNIKKKDLDKNINLGRNATPASLTSGVRLVKTKRLKLGDFGAKQTSGGVSYKIQVGGGKGQIAHAFGPKIARLSNQVFVRDHEFAPPKQGRYEGRVTKRAGKRSGPAGSRLVREQMAGPKRGVSAWGAFLKTGMLQPTVKASQELLDKNVEHRTKFLVLKANGQV
jgi:hypothetical protein